MPTSSQALLLKHSDGALHQTFGRPYWHPDQSHLDVYTKPEFIQDSFLSSKQRRKSPQRIPTTVPTKTQNVRYDFQSLPELLQINGIHGSLSFDESTNSLRVTVPSYHQNALRNTHKNWRLTLSNDNTIQPTTLWSSIRHLRGIVGEGNERRIDSDNNSDVLSHEIQDPKHRAQNKGNGLIKMKVTEGETIKMVNVPTKDADYFHLIQETADGVFRLVKANPKDAGSFRLEGTMATDVGDFRLVPEDGFECDDFRLVIVDADNAHFRLLQADPIDGKWFRPIIMSTKSDGEFRLVQAAVDAKYAANQKSIGQNCDKDATKWNRDFNSHKKKLSVTREMVRLRERDNGLAKFVNAPVEYADYFRLVQESSDGVFRLSRSHPEDEGSFRLTWTRPDELGDFRLISADGFETDDYRLVCENTQSGHGQFRLLKADSLDGKSFRFIAMSKESDGLFRLPEVKLRENVQTYSESPSSIEGNVAQEIRTSKMVKLRRSNNSVGKSHRYRSVQDEGTDNVTDNLVFLRSVVVEDESVDCASLPPALPDIALYDPRYLTGTQKLKTMHNSKRHLQSSRKAVSEVEVLQHGRSNFDSLTQYRGQQQRQFNLNDKGAMQTDGVRDRNTSELISRSSSDNGMGAFREKFIDSYREASPETYEKLIKLGFRPTNEVMVNQEGFKFDSLDGRLRSKPLSPKDPFRNNPYITTSFNERESTHDHYGVAGTISNDSMARELKSNLSPTELRKLRSHQERKTSLIDEVKLKANYKAWKKRKITAVRMRKELPPKDPNAVVVSFRDNAIPHETLKQVVENSAGSHIHSLQYDPVSIHSIDSDAKSQWVIRFDDAGVCKRLVETGLWVNGDILPVRKYDDVMKEEHDAYQYSLILNEYRKVKQTKQAESERHAKLKTQRQKLKSSHTQTAGISC